MLRSLIPLVACSLLGASEPEAPQSPWAFTIGRAISAQTTLPSLDGAKGLRVAGIWNHDLTHRQGFQVRLGMTSIKGTTAVTDYRTDYVMDGPYPRIQRVPIEWRKSDLTSAQATAHYRFAFREQRTSPYLIAGLGAARYSLKTDVTTANNTQRVDEREWGSVFMGGAGMTFRQGFSVELSLELGSLNVSPITALSLSYRF